MKEQSLVSVVIPTYSRPDNIVRSIESVLAQTYKNIEIIVVDDNGVGTHHQIETENVLKDYMDKGIITYIKHEVNKNGAAARNTGFRASRGKYVNFLDDDDVFLSDMIDKQVKVLEGTTPLVGGSYSPVCFITKNQGLIKEIPTLCDKEGNLCAEFLLGKVHFNTSGLLFKREAVEKLCGFDESYKRHQDFELMIRFFEHYTLKCGSSFPLYYMDITSAGTHGIPPVDRYEFEREFLHKFSASLKRMNCYETVCHFFYFQCCESELANGLYRKSVRSLLSSLSYGWLTLSEVKGLYKSLKKCYSN